MKVLVVFPSPLRGGAEEYALAVARGALQRGHTVHAVFPDTPLTESLVEEFSAAGCTYSAGCFANVAGSRLEIAVKDSMNWFFSLANLRRIRPDVVLANAPMPHTLFETTVACAILRVPALVVFHMTFGTPGVGCVRRWLRKAALGRGQRFVTVSEGARAVIAEKFRIPTAAVGRIHLGVKLEDGAGEDASEARGSVRRELNLAEESRLVLTVARLNQVKGHDLLVAAIGRMIGEFPGVYFAWAGDGDLAAPLQQLVKVRGIGERVLFLGYRKDVPRLLRAADLFVLPSRYESFPFALLEAMAHGAPVISSTGGSIPELVTHQEHGLLFESGNALDLEAQLRWALNHPEEMRAFADNAHRRALEFSEERMVEETIALLEDLVGVRGGAA